jgi:hypothetical protein
MTSTAAFEMAMVHRFFRNELHGVPELINSVRAVSAHRGPGVGHDIDHHHAGGQYRRDVLDWAQTLPAGRTLPT